MIGILFRLKKRSQRGSALVMVLIVLTILSLSGISILSISTINFKMKALDDKAKKTFYLAEAGLEEVYAMIAKEVEQAIDIGNHQIEEKLDSYDQEDPPIQIWFQEGYKEYINHHLTNKIVYNDYGTLDPILNHRKPVIEKLNEKPFYNGNDIYEVIFQSTYRYENVMKQLSAKFKIYIPDYHEMKSIRDTVIQSIEMDYLIDH